MTAALETLKTEGFAGTSARAIASRGGFNQALIFYHFGSLTDLLLAALERTSRDRMESYRSAVDAAGSLQDLVQVAARLHGEDLRSGHITVVSEMIAGSLTHPELGPEIVRQMQPWLDFTTATIEKVLAGSPFEDMFPARDVAFAVVAFYLGADLLAQLDSDHERVERVLSMGTSFLPLVAPMLSWGSR